MKNKNMILVAVLVVAVVAVGIFWLGMRKIPTTPSDSNQGQAVVNDENTQNPVTDNTNVIQPEAYPQHIEAIAGTDEVWYNIPELGIRMRLNKEFAEDLVYVYDNKYSRVMFQTKSILAVAPQCRVEDADFGDLYRVDGTIKEAYRERGADPSVGFLDLEYAVQLPEFFVALSTVHADACWWSRTGTPTAEEITDHVYKGAGVQSVYDAVKKKVIQPISQK